MGPCWDLVLCRLFPGCAAVRARMCPTLQGSVGKGVGEGFLSPPWGQGHPGNHGGLQESGRQDPRMPAANTQPWPEFSLKWMVWDLPAGCQLPLSLWGCLDVPGQGSLQLSLRFWSRLGVAWREQGLVDRASPGVTGSFCTAWRKGATQLSPGWASHCCLGLAQLTLVL